MTISRTDRSLLTDWWFTVDRVLLTTVLLLAGSGLILSLAASPAVALKKGFTAFHFVERHFAYTVIGLGMMLTVSFLQPRTIRRLALVVFFGAVAVMIAVLIGGDEINGAKRWLRIASFSLQPSEIAKPAFVVLAAWAFAETQRRTDMPALTIAASLYGVFGALLILQPDIGQTLLVSLTWGILFLLSGQSILSAIVLALLGVGGLVTAYFTLGYVRLRIDRFIAVAPDDNSQTARALQSFIEGGFLGRGPGEGTIKTSLPDAHTDFIFAVVAEEYGAVVCMALACLFAAVVLRAFVRSFGETDHFSRLAVAGLSAMFGFQALINMAVNVGLLPAKGMTLPFISAGGSSLLSVYLTMGILLALTRWRPDLSRLRRPQLSATTDRIGQLGPTIQ
jgi:cell division protein FtsW